MNRHLSWRHMSRDVWRHDMLACNSDKYDNDDDENDDDSDEDDKKWCQMSPL